MSSFLLITTEDNVPTEVILLDNVEPDVDRELAQEAFLAKCRERFSNFDQYTQADIQVILDQGYEKSGNGSVCLYDPSDDN